MASYPLSFPVFYYGIVEKNTNLRQYNAVNALLCGRTCDKLKDHERISDSDASRYVHGTRIISDTISASLLRCSHEELKDRLLLLKFQDINRVVEAAKKLLAISTLREETRKELLREGEQAKDGYDFIAKIFYTAIKCPSNEQIRLQGSDISSIRAELSKPAVEDKAEQKESVDNSESSSGLLDGNKTVKLAYHYRNESESGDRNIEMEFTWNQLFVVVARYLIDERSEFYIKQALENLFLDTLHGRNRTRSVHCWIQDDSAYEVLWKFKALGLIESVGKKGRGNTDIFWKLTEAGTSMAQKIFQA